MGISENNAHYGHRLRVYRKIGDIIYDEVYYLTESGKPVSKKREREIRALAKARDKELSTLQVEHQEKINFENPVKFHKDGRIIGLTRQHQGSKKSPSDIFKIRIRKPDHSIYWGSISIDLYGFDEAYTQAIKRIAEVLNINKRTKIYQQMKSAQSTY
jgi:hypothetical protein